MSTLKTINIIHPSGSTTNIINDSSGNVGIANPTPGARLDVLGSQGGISNPANGTVNIVDSTAAALGVGGQVVFRGQYTSGTYTQYGSITAYKESATVDGTQYGAALIFNTRTQGGNNTEKGRFSSAGGFMVGTTTDPGAGYIADVSGNVRTVPPNSQTTSYTLVAADNGKYVSITTGGVTVPSGIFSAGQSISVYNDSGSSQTITQGGSVTMYQVGTANTGNRTLAQRGLCTILCVASNTFVITGGGVS